MDCSQRAPRHTAPYNWRPQLPGPGRPPRTVNQHLPCWCGSRDTAIPRFSFTVAPRLRVPAPHVPCLSIREAPQLSCHTSSLSSPALLKPSSLLTENYLDAKDSEICTASLSLYLKLWAHIIKCLLFILWAIMGMSHVTCLNETGPKAYPSHRLPLCCVPSTLELFSTLLSLTFHMRQKKELVALPSKHK